jgi:hypothetical protein
MPHMPQTVRPAQGESYVAKAHIAAARHPGRARRVRLGAVLGPRLSRRHRRPDGSGVAADAPAPPGAFHAPVRLADRVANWPPGTPVTIVEPFGPSVMVEVADAEGDTLDVLVVRSDLLTV